MSKEQKIQPRTLQGFEDRHGEEMIIRNYVKSTWEEVFQSFGYSAIETPSIEYAEILTGKYGEEEKLIYHFEDQGKRKVALRYDQTVPFARYLTQHRGQIHLPFKRYEIARVWRADAARKGRRREFYQCDIDIAGSTDMMADSEILQVLYTGFMNLEFPEHKILLNHRQLVTGFIQYLKIPEDKELEVYRAIDKLDKVGLDGVKKELEKRGVPSGAHQAILDFISIKEGDNQATLDQIAKLVGDNPLSQKGLTELREIISICSAYGLNDKNLIISPRLVRGLDYYTGAVFEVLVDDFPGSLAGGGRYDGLCSRFSKEDIPAVGVAVGFEPLCMHITEKGMGPENQSPADVFIVLFNEEMRGDILALSKVLREQGIRVQTAYKADKLGKQFQLADRLNIPKVIVIGPDEKERGVAVLKNMKTGEQEELSIETISKLLIV